MKKYVLPLVLSLLVCLFIYVFYRTEKTLVNKIIMALISHDTYYRLKYFITSALPLNDWLVFSLPEGLWVFCITITSGVFYVKVGERRLSLSFLPILLAVFMELFQLFGITNGRFDWMDIIFRECSGYWL